MPTKTYSNEVVTLWYRPPDVLLGSTEYTTSIDMWGVGCIFFEMASGRPLFPGSTVEDELHLIFRTLGTPTERKWKGITKKEEFLSFNFPHYEPESLFTRVPRLDSDGMDLLMRYLRVRIILNPLVVNNCCETVTAIAINAIISIIMFYSHILSNELIF